jgi:hypothetical protein
VISQGVIQSTRKNIKIAKHKLNKICEPDNKKVKTNSLPSLMITQSL